MTLLTFSVEVGIIFFTAYTAMLSSTDVILTEPIKLIITHNVLV